MTCRRTTAISWKIFSHLTSKFLSKQTVIRRDPWPLPVSIQVSSTRGSCHSNLHLSRQTVEMRFCSNCLSSFYHKFFLRIRLEHPQCSSYSRNTDRNADSEQRMPGPPKICVLQFLAPKITHKSVVRRIPVIKDRKELFLNLAWRNEAEHGV
jgi:hypothetical protein